MLSPQADLPGAAASGQVFGANIAARSAGENGTASREEIEARILLARAESRNDVVRLEGKFDVLERHLTAQLNALSNDMRRIRDDVRDARVAMTITTIAAALFLAALVIAIALMEDTGFRRGLAVRDAVSAATASDATRIRPSRAPAP